MNPVVPVQLLAALLAYAVAGPLIRGTVSRNDAYGVRLPASFASPAAWLELNRLGGRLLRREAVLIGAMALVGAFLGREHWVTYNWASLGVTLGGLALLATRVCSRARRLAAAPAGTGHPPSEG